MTKYIHIDDEFWDEIEDGENIVIYHNGNEENIVVPEELGGHPVTRIGKLKPTDEAKSITIPKTVTVIEDDAFDGFPEDFVIYCYPTTEYSNEDGYKIVYLEDNEEAAQEDPVLKETAPEEAAQEESSTNEESSVNEQATEGTTDEQEVVITSVDEDSLIETTTTPSEEPTSSTGSTFLGSVIFVIALILLGVSFLLREDK